MLNIKDVSKKPRILLFFKTSIYYIDKRKCAMYQENYFLIQNKLDYHISTYEHKKTPVSNDRIEYSFCSKLGNGNAILKSFFDFIALKIKLGFTKTKSI